MKIEDKIAKLIVDEVAIDSVVDRLITPYDQIPSEFKGDSKELYLSVKNNMRYVVSRLLFQLKRSD